MANERQTSRSNEANQNAIDALGVSVSTLETTVDSSAANPTDWVYGSNSIVSKNISLTYTGYIGLFSQTADPGTIATGTTTFTVLSDPAPIPGAEQWFRFNADASKSNMAWQPDGNMYWVMTGESTPDESNWTTSFVPDTSKGPAGNKGFLVRVKCLELVAGQPTIQMDIKGYRSYIES